MADSITVSPIGPSPTNPIQVQGGGGNFYLSVVSGQATTDTATKPAIAVRICDPGDGSTCKTPKDVNPNDIGLLGHAAGVWVWSWRAFGILVKNVSQTGADNDAIARINNALDSSPVGFLAANPGAFVTLAHHHHHHHHHLMRPLYRLRFLTGSIVEIFGKMADLGMDKSNRVKLWKIDRRWASPGDLWTLEVAGTTAVIKANIPLTATIKIPQTWTCLGFHPIHGGDFNPDLIDDGNGGFEQPCMPLFLRVS